MRWGGGGGKLSWGAEQTFPAVFISIKELVKVLKGSKIRHTAPPFIALNDVIFKANFITFKIQISI